MRSATTRRPASASSRRSTGSTSSRSPLGSSAGAALGDTVIFAGSGGRRHALVATLVARQEFAGYWEYVLDEAIFTGPAHPFWGGGAVLDEAGRLIGIGSLQIEHRRPSGESVTLNMVVPIDLLKPILDEMLTTGQVARTKRPWLGLYVAEVDDGFAVIGVAEGGPADSAGIRPGDRVRAVAGVEPDSLAALFRAIWSSGTAGDTVRIALERDGEPTRDRGRLLRARPVSQGPQTAFLTGGTSPAHHAFALAMNSRIS